MGPTGSRRRRRFLFVPFLLTVALALFLTAGAQAVHTEGLFELDRNAVNDPAAGNDWDQVFANFSTNCASLGALACSFDNDPANTTIFTTGGSKDDLDINVPPTVNWQWTGGSVPDKDEIDDAYAAMYSPTSGDLAGHQVLYFGADRHANNGSSDFGFWFFKSTVSLNANGTFSGVHTVGDVLLLSTFTTGGATTTIRAFKWVGSGGTDGSNGSLQSLGTSLPDCVPGPAAGDAGCGTVNAASTPSPWPYTPKSGPSGSFPSGSFFEGGVDLTQLQVAGCFSSFLAETRSSPSVGAQLKDFVLGSFQPCKARIKILPSATNEVGTNHTFTITVEKIDPSTGFAFGPASGVAVTTSKSDSNGASSSYVPAGANTCTTGAQGTCTVTITSPTAGQTTVSASATVPFSGGGSANVATDGTGGSSGPAVKTFVDANIAIAPNDTNGIGENHTFTVTVKKNAGDGAGFVTATSGHVDVTLTPSGGANPVIDNLSSTCDNAGSNLDSSGQCTLTFTSQTAGTVVGNASVSLSVGGVSLTRSTSGNAGPGGSGPATKIFVDGSIKWTKVDKANGQLLGGAVFQVCHTDNINSSTTPDSFVPITPPDCFSVADNVSPDADSTDGKFELDHLYLGKYTITETSPPPGYQPDPTPKTATLTTDNLPASANVDVGAFQDERSFRLIVITCNDSTNPKTLVESEVTLSGQATTNTITGVPAALAAKGVTQADLCAIGGAAYGALPANTYNPSVKLPKAP
jgi:hypothetical protein